MSHRLNKKRRVEGDQEDTDTTDEETPLLGEEQARRYDQANDNSEEEKDQVVDMKHLAPVSIVDTGNTWPRAIQSSVVHTAVNESFQGPDEAVKLDEYYKTNESGHFVRHRDRQDHSRKFGLRVRRGRHYSTA